MSDDWSTEKISLAPDLEVKLKAKVLYLYGNTHAEISRQLGVKVQNIRAWSKADHWDQSRSEILREINLKILRKVQKQYSNIINDQFSTIKVLKERLWNELTGHNPDNPTSPLPNPSGQLVLSGDKLIGHIIKLMGVEKDLTIDTLGMITEATPKLNPRDIEVAQIDNEGDSNG